MKKSIGLIGWKKKETDQILSRLSHLKKKYPILQFSKLIEVDQFQRKFNKSILILLNSPKRNLSEQLKNLPKYPKPICVLLVCKKNNKIQTKQLLFQNTIAFIHEDDLETLPLQLKKGIRNSPYISSQLIPDLIWEICRENTKPFPSEISNREMEILKLLGTGLSGVCIAEILGITERTVRFHISNLHTKMGVKNRKGLLEKLEKEGIKKIYEKPTGKI